MSWRWGIRRAGPPLRDGGTLRQQLVEPLVVVRPLAYPVRQRSRDRELLHPATAEHYGVDRPILVPAGPMLSLRARRQVGLPQSFRRTPVIACRSLHRRPARGARALRGPLPPHGNRSRVPAGKSPSGERGSAPSCPEAASPPSPRRWPPLAYGVAGTESCSYHATEWPGRGRVGRGHPSAVTASSRALRAGSSPWFRKMRSGTPGSERHQRSSSARSAWADRSLR